MSSEACTLIFSSFPSWGFTKNEMKIYSWFHSYYECLWCLYSDYKNNHLFLLLLGISSVPVPNTPSLPFSVYVALWREGDIRRWRNSVQLTPEQHGFELSGSTYLWIFSINTQSALSFPKFHIHRFDQPRIETVLSIHRKESSGVEGQLYIFLYNILYKGP